MRETIIQGADTVSRFCRLQMNVKRDIPIRASEMGVLILIHTNREAVSPLMISSFFGISKPSVTDMVNSLIKKGYLDKEPSEKDKRSYCLKITERGCELVESAYKEYFRIMELLEKNMGHEDFNQLIELLKRANKIIAEEKDI